MSPCLCGNCLAPKYCQDGRQECHINAYACAGVKADQLARAEGRSGTGRTYERVCIGLRGEIPVYEQVEK